MENSKKVTREQIKRAAAAIVKSIRHTVVFSEVEYPGTGEPLVEELVAQLQTMLPKKEQTEGCTCPSDASGEAKCNCCDGMKNPEKTVQYMDFGSAIQAVKQGKSIARKGWNGKHQYVELATCISYKAAAGEIVNVHHNNIGNAALAFIGTSGVQLGWLASQADMLAEDWYIVE